MASSSPANGVPACGRCGESLPWLASTSDDRFDEALSAPIPVLVDFWAPWCGPCRMVAPVLAEIAAEHKGRIKIVKLNVDENPVTAERFRVQGIPMLMLFENGEERETVVGALPKGALMEKIGPYLRAT